MKQGRVAAPILMYHRLGAVRRDSIVPAHYVSERRLNSHLRLLEALRFTSVSLSELRNGLIENDPLPARPISITFDDGYESFYEVGLASLEARKMRATVFLVSELVGGQNVWDQNRGDVNEPLMSREQIRDAVNRNTEFGSHTLTHANLVDVGPNEAMAEIRESKDNLERWIGVPIEFFCYPYGKESSEIRQIVRDAGYLGATTVAKGVNTSSTDPFGWRRINVRSTTTAWQLAFKLWRAFRLPSD